MKSSVFTALFLIKSFNYCYLVTLFILLPMPFLLTDCKLKPEYPCVNNECFNVEKFSRMIQDTLNGNVTGYALSISRGAWVSQATFGVARTNFDPPAQNFTQDNRVNVASVNKTITTAAVLQLLESNPNIDVDSSIDPYLPSSWSRGPNINTINFRELLTHMSGIRGAGPNANLYSDLRTLVANGIDPANKVYDYENQNFALFRIIIPYLNGFNENGIQNMESALSTAYLQYITDNVITSKIARNVSCTPPTTSPTLYYPFPPGNTNGTTFRNFALRCGSGGLHLSADEIRKFLVSLRETNDIMQDNTKRLMESDTLGWYRLSVKNGQYFSHGGLLTNGNQANLIQLNSFFASIKIDGDDLYIHVALVVNSPLPNRMAPRQIINNAYNASWEPK